MMRYSVLAMLLCVAYPLLSLLLRPLLSAREKYWLRQEWPGFNKSWWPISFRGSIKSITNAKFIIRDGYKKVGAAACLQSRCWSDAGNSSPATVSPSPFLNSTATPSS